ncbi:MAG: DNA repair protein RecN [Candidatus Riflebacteria bacterium HGW-Riflebacteria-1]|jgi:DNA repair protein RecN (Recombination protein N)|nr:MAG: DNA repair protein RecN [Candidatus Riflebacteria bacterium HGW-Riflebacteria-1]
MITEILLENFLFMQKAALKFSRGLNVITGETGAGKSILLEAVKLLLGKKARSGLVLAGQTTARIQAEFDIATLPELARFLEESGFHNEEDPHTLSITRTFKEEGNGRVLVNGILTTAAFLKQIGPFLTEIHGQNEHQTLLEPEIQRGLLDRTGSAAFKQSLTTLQSVFTQRQKLQQKLQELENRQQTSATRISELQTILQELTAMNLSNPNEEEELKEELKRLSHAEQIISSLQTAGSLLSGSEESVGATSQIFKSADNLKRISQYDKAIDELYHRLNGSYYELKALEADIEALADKTALDPERLYKIQSRLSEISRVCRKHATDFPGLFALRERVNEELSELFAPDSTRDRLKKELELIDAHFKELIKAISTERAILAKKLDKQVSTEMADLGFNSAKFTAELTACNPGPHGAENIEFCVSLNPGAPGGALRKIASGGELSRVALAIKKVLARSDALPTLVFDEIDAGIGGKTAEAVAASLRALGKEKQVLLVTHLHQIAKEGSCHFTVTKRVENGHTSVDISEVESESRIEEIARMLGRTDKEGLSFARNLLKQNG